MQKIILSILVTNYNYGRYLEEAIDSLFAHPFMEEVEVLLIDDASTDNSHAVIAHLQEKYTSLRVFFHDCNKGQGAGIKYLLSKARGEYVHPFAADDVMLDLGCVISHLKKYKDLPAFCAPNVYFNGSGQHIDPLLSLKEFQFFYPHEVKKLFAHTRFWIPGHTIFVKKRLYEKYGPFLPKLQMLNDWWVNHRIALFEGVGFIPYPISANREHAQSFGATKTAEQRKEVWHILFQMLNEDPSLQPLWKTGIFRMFGVRTIAAELLFSPHLWKYAFPMLRKEVEKQVCKILNIDAGRWWIQRINKLHGMR